MLLPLTKHSGKYRQAESGLRAGAQLSSGIYADADRNVANGFILRPNRDAQMGIPARASFLLRYGCCAEAVTHAQEKEEPEEQRERLARVVGRSRRRRVPLPGFDSP